MKCNRVRRRENVTCFDRDRISETLSNDGSGVMKRHTSSFRKWSLRFAMKLMFRGMEIIRQDLIDFIRINSLYLQIKHPAFEVPTFCVKRHYCSHVPTIPKNDAKIPTCPYIWKHLPAWLSLSLLVLRGQRWVPVPFRAAALCVPGRVSNRKRTENRNWTIIFLLNRNELNRNIRRQFRAEPEPNLKEKI